MLGPVLQHGTSGIERSCYRLCYNCCSTAECPLLPHSASCSCSSTIGLACLHKEEDFCRWDSLPDNTEGSTMWGCFENVFLNFNKIHEFSEKMTIALPTERWTNAALFGHSWSTHHGFIRHRNTHKSCTTEKIHKCKCMGRSQQKRKVLNTSGKEKLAHAKQKRVQWPLWRNAKVGSVVEFREKAAEVLFLVSSSLGVLGKVCLSLHVCVICFHYLSQVCVTKLHMCAWAVVSVFSSLDLLGTFLSHCEWSAHLFPCRQHTADVFFKSKNVTSAMCTCKL